MTPSILTVRALPARLRAPTAAWAFTAAGLVAIGVYFLLPSGSTAQSLFFVVIGCASVGAIFIGTVRNLPRGDRLAWHLFSLGLLGQVAGDAIFAIYEIDLSREPTSPSVADAFYLGGYPLLAVGIWLVLRKLGGQTSRVAMLDSAVIFCGVSLLQWVFFIDPYNHQHFGTESARLVAMAYPAVDVLLLVGVAQLLVGPGGRTTAYRFLVTSVALWVVADEVYGLTASTYQGGQWIDALWLGSYVVWGRGPRPVHGAHRAARSPNAPAVDPNQAGPPCRSVARCARDSDHREQRSPPRARLCNRDRGRPAGLARACPAQRACPHR